MLVRVNRDILCGMAFCAIGLTFLLLSREYGFGRVGRMGPGYFPSVLAVLLCGLGLVVGFRGWRADAGAVRPDIADDSAWRRIAIVAAMVAAASVAVMSGVVPRTALFLGAGIGLAIAFFIGQRVMALILAPIAIFAGLLETIGLIAASVMLVVLAGFASNDSRPVETMALSAVLAAFAWAVFVAGLGLQLPVWPKLG